MNRRSFILFLPHKTGLLSVIPFTAQQIMAYQERQFKFHNALTPTKNPSVLTCSNKDSAEVRDATKFVTCTGCTS
jgi:hypothetical protein